MVESKDFFEHVDATVNVMGMLFAALFLSKPRNTFDEQAQSNASTIVVEMSQTNTEAGREGEVGGN